MRSSTPRPTTSPAAETGELLGRLVLEEAAFEPALPGDEAEKMQREIRIAEGADGLEENLMRFGELSPFTCPECRGVLTLLRQGGLVRFSLPYRARGVGEHRDAPQYASEGLNTDGLRAGAAS